MSAEHRSPLGGPDARPVNQFVPGLVADEAADAGPAWNVNLTTPRVKLLDIALFASQWQAMEGAGIPTVATLGLLARATRSSSPALASALEDIRVNVEEGLQLGEAFRMHVDIFGELPCEMIATGEETGTLERHLGDIAADCEYRHANKSTLIAAMVEPFLIVVTGIVVCWMLMTWSIPQFKTLYQTLTKDGTLPLPTEILMWLSDFLNSPLGWTLQAVAVGLVVGFFVLARKHLAFKHFVHTQILRLPLFGDLALLEAVARGSRTLAVVQKSVGNIPMGIALAAKTTTNLRIADAFTDVGEEVYRGSTVWEGMASTGMFPELTVYMTRSGELSGNFDVMLEKLAETYERRIRYVRERTTEVLRYGLLLVMGGFVISIMLAMYLPIFSLINKMSR